MNKNFSFAVGALVLGAFLLRVIFLLLAGVDAPLTGDELAYQQIAENVAAGRGFFQDNNPFFPGQILYAWQAPLYPLALAILYKIFGVNILLAKLFGILISTATVYVMYDLTLRVARSTFDAPRFTLHAPRSSLHAFLAALLIAIYPGLLTHAHLLLSETLFIFLLLLAFALVARALESMLSLRAVLARNLDVRDEISRSARNDIEGIVIPNKVRNLDVRDEISRSARNDKLRAWLWIVGAGMMWGLATLTRGITLYFTPLLALWLVWALGRARVSIAHTAAAILFCAATMVVIVPWTARNYFQFQQLVVLETKGGVNLWLGNSPHTPNDFIRNVWKVGVREPMLNGLPTEELARDRAAYALALEFIRAEPQTFFARMPVKFADFWGFERNLPDIAEATTRGGGWNSFAKIAADGFAAAVYIAVMVCGVAGFVLAPMDKWKILFGAFTLYFVFVHLVIFGDGRFHLPLIPFFALYASWLFVMLRYRKFASPDANSTLCSRKSRVVLAAILVLLLLFVWAREAWTAWEILRTSFPLL